MRTYSKALQTDTEDLALDAVLHVVLLLGKDSVEGLLQECAIKEMIDRHVFTSIMHPHVHYTWITLCLTYHVSDFTAPFGMLHPKIADSLVRIGERKITALGM